MSEKSGAQAASQQLSNGELQHASFEAARAITNDMATQAPIINGLVSQTLIEANTNCVKTLEKGNEVHWRVSKGSFIDEEGHRLQLATRMPSKTKKREDDLDYVLGSSRIIVDGNIEHVAATINYGHILNNNDEMTAVLPDHPIGFKNMFQTILNDSVKIAKEELHLVALEKEEKSRRLRKFGRFLIACTAVASIGVFGGPKIAEEYFEYREDRQEQEAIDEARADAVAEEVARQRVAAIETFDTDFPVINDGALLEDEQRALVPATREFVIADFIPDYDPELGLSQLEQVRSFRAPSIGETYSIPLPVAEGQRMTIAHTGDSGLLVTALLDSASQTLTITSIDIGIELPEGTPTPQTGEIVITLNN